ncbi:MAG: hypothetical protein LC663_00890 [Actinobacteria bacterium]|nr:hypothetical protein [Actinomycetota bacterium]
MVVIVEMLLTDHPGWLDSFLRLAATEGERAAVRLYGPDAGSRPAVERSARVVFGEPAQHPDGGIVMPVSWRVQGYRALPPSFEGDLSVTPAGGKTEVVIEGTWAADPDRSNATLDAAFAAARTTVERMLVTLRIAVEEAAAAHA